MINPLGIQTWADVRNLIHVAGPALTILLVTTGVADANLAAMIVAVAVAITSPALATINTVSGFRTWLYPVLGAVAGLAIFLDYMTAAHWSAIIPIIAVVLGGGVAGANTPTVETD